MKKIFLFLGALIVLSSPVSALTAYADSVSCDPETNNFWTGIVNCANAGDGNYETYAEFASSQQYVTWSYILNYTLQSGTVTHLSLVHYFDASDDGWLPTIYCMKDGLWMKVAEILEKNFLGYCWLHNFDYIDLPSACLLAGNKITIKYTQGPGGGYVKLFESQIDYSLVEKDYYTKEEIDEKISELLVEKDYYTKEEIDNKINPLISQIASLQEILKAIQATLNGFIDKIMTYLKYLPKGTRQNMLCGYMKENKLKSYKDLGLECRITRGKCYCN